MIASSIYSGTVRHRRTITAERDFSYPLSLVLIDLAELPHLADGALISRIPGPWRFRRRDYLGPIDQPLERTVRDRVELETGERPRGPIRMLTQLRCFGMSFNPVTLYYCYHADGTTLHSVIAEVTNTPWRERHAYVLGPWAAGGVQRAEVSKVHHVSPFLGMDMRYEISLSPPGETLSLHIACVRDEETAFDATLSLTRRHELSAENLSQLVSEQPLAPLQTLARIYTQGLTLKFRGVPVHPHPEMRSRVHHDRDLPAPAVPSDQATIPQRLARRAGIALLSLTRTGTVTVLDGASIWRFGDGEPQATLTVRSPHFWTALLRGSIGLADAYAAGWFDSEDLVEMIRVAALNTRQLDGPRRAIAPLRTPFQSVREYSRPLTRERNRREIAAHYDLGNDLFELMLDPTMSYSCAIFDRPGLSLEEAQLTKLERICERLELSSADHLLEIGTGWGGLAIYAAKTRGCRVTTATISVEQHRLARERVRAEGLDKLVDVIFCDYRDLRGRYDKLVSVEMVEAVGWRNFGRYLRKCSSLLEPDGLMLMQAITIDDRAYEVERASKSFIKSYIFPGGCLPSVSVLTANLARRTDMQVSGIDDITVHYVETLRRWRENLDAHAGQLDELGYDERFRRIWRLYLAYCEAGFAERRILDLQLLLAKPRYRQAPGRSAAAAALADPRGIDDLALEA